MRIHIAVVTWKFVAWMLGRQVFGVVKVSVVIITAEATSTESSASANATECVAISFLAPLWRRSCHHTVGCILVLMLSRKI